MGLFLHFGHKMVIFAWMQMCMYLQESASAGFDVNNVARFQMTEIYNSS